VRNRERVVSKLELLDALWPSVTVTENSLQRAVSTLRAVLREGGMEGALRSFPSKGHRFCVDIASEQKVSGATQAIRSRSAEEARRAITEQRWHDAVLLYEQQTTDALDGKDLEHWSLALQCLGKQPEALPVLVRAGEGLLQRGK
jgi:hypothetical protein